jgi:hypothetical protein
VYVAEHLPRMEMLGAAPTRELVAFETRALRELASGASLVSEGRPGELRMLGPVRAGDRCARCHAVNRGALLGAFSYTLRRLGRP